MYNEVNHTRLEQILQGKIAQAERTIEQDQKRLAENFIHNFAWCGESLYKALWMSQYCKNMLEDCSVHGAEAVGNHMLKSLLSNVSRVYNVRVDSTGSLHREVSTWQYQLQLELLNDITGNSYL